MSAKTNVHPHANRERDGYGFSLLEVIFALGIFAGGVLVVIGFFPVLTKSVEGNAQADAATRVAETFLAQLRAQPLADVAAMLRTPSELAAADANSAEDEQLIFASFAGDRIAPRNDAVWRGRERDRYFDLALVRNETLSPAVNDTSAGWMAFSLRVRWPVLPAPAGQEAQWFSGAVHR